MTRRCWAIIGGGNGGQALAGHLAILGEKVRLYDKFQETIKLIDEAGGIRLHNALEGFGKIEFATSNIEKAMDGADNIVIVLPSIYHEEIGRKCIPYLKDGQVVLLHPEASCGALFFRKLMKELNCTAKVVLGATDTLLYSCRSNFPGDVHIFGHKQRVAMAALPSSNNLILEEAITGALPWLMSVDNVLYTSLANPNAIMHPAPMIFNLARIEAEPPEDYGYYREGITPSIGYYLENMDRERMQIAKELNLEIPSILQNSTEMYKVNDTYNSIHKFCKHSEAHKNIIAPKTFKNRYVLEDIPFSLVAIQSIARIVDVSTPYIDTIVDMGYLLLDGELGTGRSPKALGIDGMRKEDLIAVVSGK